MYKIAHRGYSDLHKDNTMPSFLAAILLYHLYATL